MELGRYRVVVLFCSHGCLPESSAGFDFEELAPVIVAHFRSAGCDDDDDDDDDIIGCITIRLLFLFLKIFLFML